MRMLRSSVRRLETLHRLSLRQIHNQSSSKLIFNHQIKSIHGKGKNNKSHHHHLSSFDSRLTLILPQLSSAFHTGAIRLATSEDSLDQSLHRIDVEIRRTGRINRREIEEILEDVKQLNSMTSNQSLMIIRCCGELVPEETFENRTKLVQEVWKTMDKLKVPMDISHYNALLRVYLENEYKFNPTEFLLDLSSKGLEPNRVTYQRLITRFCQDADIDGASTILQHMKEKQLPINVHVFNALILGHGQGGDMESAEGILGVMKQAGLEPNDDSYATLMRGYAKKGDLENIRRIVAECEQQEIFLVDRDFLEVIFTLASSKHNDLVKDVIPMIKRHAGFNQEVTNVILRLVTIGQEDVALQLLKEMPRSMRSADEAAPSGNFLIRQLVASDTPTEKVIRICHELMSANLNRHALLRASEFSLQSKQFEKTFDFFEALKESGFPIRQHYFWPFFASAKSEKEVYDGLKCMSYMEVSPTVETLRDYIIPALLNVPTKSTKSYEHILEKLSNYTTIPTGTVVPAALQYILQNSQLDIAATFALKYRVKFNHVGIRRALIDAFLKTRDAKAFVQIVASAGFDGEDSAREAMGTVLMDLLDYNRGNVSKVELLMPILQECLNHGLGLSNSSLEWIQNNLGEELTPEVSNVILQLTSGDLSLNSSIFASQGKGLVKFDEKTTADLEEMLRMAGEMGKSTKGIKKALLINYCRERNLEKAEALYHELQNENFVFTGGIYALLLDVYCSANNLEKCREMFHQLAAREFFVLDDLKLLRFALVLISNGQLEECLKVLKSQPRDADRVPQGANQVALVWKILNTCAEKGDVDGVRELFNTLKERGLTPVNNVVLGPLVKAHLVKDDLDGALKEFESCVNEYNVTPWKSELFCRFIKADDADRLQRVLDLSTKQHGEINSLYDLIFAFLECGKIRQARKIVDTPGFRARNEKLEFTCQHYLEEGKVEELEKLVEITRDVFNVDRNSLYFFLLKAYCKVGDATKALSVWTSLQEENIQPSEELMIHLAKFLKDKNLDVPFVVPELKPESPTVAPTLAVVGVGRKRGDADVPKKRIMETTSTERKINSSLNSTSVELRNYLQNDELDKALQLHQRLESEGRSLSLHDTSYLISRMARAERLGEATRLTNQMLQNGLHPHPRVLKFYTGRLAAAGEVQTLIQLETSLSDDLKRIVMLNSRICVAHVEAGKGQEYFEKYIKGKVSLKREGGQLESSELLPVSAAAFILRRNPELLPEFEALEPEVKDEMNRRNFHNVLWLTHFMDRDYSKAQQILETKLNIEGKDMEELKFNSVLKEARSKKDEELVGALAKQLLPIKSMSAPAKGAIVSCQIGILCEVGKSSEALDILRLHLDSASVELKDLSAGVLLRLSADLKAQNINFPYEIPPKSTGLTTRQNRRRRTKAESSDSSESDSD